jgi:hypothetical protein
VEPPLLGIFEVGLRTGGGIGGGRLYVYPGWIRVEALKITHRALGGVGTVTHSEDPVRVITIRLLPPSFSVRVPLRDAHGEVVVSVPLWSRARLRQTFAAAGFTVQNETLWMPRGDRAPLAVPEVTIRPGLPRTHDRSHARSTRQVMRSPAR